MCFTHCLQAVCRLWGIIPGWATLTPQSLTYFLRNSRLSRTCLQPLVPLSACLQGLEAPLPPRQEAVGPAEASIPTSERRDFLHRNSHAMCV